ncbi:MAG: hypothetical protein K5860_01135 [Bacteroidales bacterium]|nr:hypothetical protein [Bacteroidales bacterium]
MKRFRLILVLFVLFAGQAFAQPGNRVGNNIFIPRDENPELKVTVKGYFGISLMTSYSGFVRYGFIQIKSTGEEQITWLSREQFLQQVTGQTVSKANPEKRNFLEDKEIMWQSFENLWKLRYSEYPYDGNTEKGWAGKDFVPSDSQWSFLKRNYHYSEMSQFLYGEDMWRLVKDSQDPDWQNQYSSLK